MVLRGVLRGVLRKGGCAETSGGASLGEEEVSVRREREFFIDNLLVLIHFIIVMIW